MFLSLKELFSSLLFLFIHSTQGIGALPSVHCHRCHRRKSPVSFCNGFLDLTEPCPHILVAWDSLVCFSCPTISLSHLSRGCFLLMKQYHSYLSLAWGKPRQHPLCSSASPLVPWGRLQQDSRAPLADVKDAGCDPPSIQYLVSGRKSQLSESQRAHGHSRPSESRCRWSMCSVLQALWPPGVTAASWPSGEGVWK
jgi:hypothetical protein